MVFCSAVIGTVSENPTAWWRSIISCHSEFTKIKTLPHTYNDTKIKRKQRPRWPTNQRKMGPDTWLQKSTCLDRCPAVGGVSIAGEEEVTGLHWTHGLVELKGSYSYELSLLDWFVVCRLTFYFCGWVPFFPLPRWVLLRRPHQQTLAMCLCYKPPTVAAAYSIS